MARAESVHSITGWVEPSRNSYKSYGQFVVLKDPVDHVRAILHDPEGLLPSGLPARVHIQATLLQARGPKDEPIFRVSHAEVQGVPPGSENFANAGVPPWTELNGGFSHPDMHITPRLFSITGSEDGGERDGDGVIDSRDFYPLDPTEWSENDFDGIGDNADLDDDNDGMSDNYEALCGLNPFGADADVDADGDKMSNGNEAKAGTLANNASSLFKLSVEAIPEIEKCFVRFPALPTRVYRLETAESLSGPWLTIFNKRPSEARVYDLSVGWANPPAFFRATASYP